MTDPIKAKIIELVPEVMELKFGCEALYRGETLTVLEKYKSFGGTGTDCVVLHTPNRLDDTETENAEVSNIIVRGSPITLAVVLRAIAQSKSKAAENFSMARHGYMRALAKYPSQQITHETTWNLPKDNYDDQSEETKAFIGKLLGVV